MNANDGAVARPRRRILATRVLFAAAVVLMAVALALGFVGRSRQSSASDTRQAADDLNEERRELQRRAQDAWGCQSEYRRLAEEVADAGFARIDAARDFNAGAGAVIDALNAAIDQTNVGNLAGAQAMFENEVGAALAAAEDDLARVQQTLRALESATESLQGAAC